LIKYGGNLQYSVYTLNNPAVEFSMKINTKRETKIGASREMEPIRSKTALMAEH
jgi:hypothetical protein